MIINRFVMHISVAVEAAPIGIEFSHGAWDRSTLTYNILLLAILFIIVTLPSAHTLAANMCLIQLLLL